MDTQGNSFAHKNGLCLYFAHKINKTQFVHDVDWHKKKWCKLPSIERKVNVYSLGMMLGNTRHVYKGVVLGTGVIVSPWPDCSQ